MTEDELEKIRNEILNKPKSDFEILDEDVKYFNDNNGNQVGYRYMLIKYSNGVQHYDLAYYGEHKDTCVFKGKPLLMIYSCLCGHHNGKLKKKINGRFDKEYSAVSLTKKITNE